MPLSCSPPNLSNLPLWLTAKVTCTASDASGNSATQLLSVAVQDTTPPVFRQDPVVAPASVSHDREPGACGWAWLSSLSWF